MKLRAVAASLSASAGEDLAPEAGKKTSDRFLPLWFSRPSNIGLGRQAGPFCLPFQSN
jgi:hypothetical protein